MIMSAKFSSNEVHNDTLENIEIVQYLEAQNVQKYFDYKIEKPKNASFQTIELLKKKQNSLSERLNKIFSQEEESNRALPPQPQEVGKKTFSDILSNKQDQKNQEVPNKIDLTPNSYHLDYGNSNGFKISPLKQSNKTNIIPQTKPQTNNKYEFNLSCDSSRKIEQSKENKNNYLLQSERQSQKVSYVQGDKLSRSNQKNIFNNRYSNQQQVLTIILEVPSGVDKLIIENEDEVPEKAKKFCIKHNYSLDCVPQLITSINQQIAALTNKNQQEDTENVNTFDISSQNNISNNQLYQLPSFQDSIFNKSLTHQNINETHQQNYNLNHKDSTSINKQNKSDIFINNNNPSQIVQSANKQPNESNKSNSNINNNINNISNGNTQTQQKKQFYNIYDSHEEALSELYNKKQQELKSYFQVETKNNKSMIQDKTQSLNESLAQSNNMLQSCKKTTKKWQRDVSPSPNQFQHTEHQSNQSEQKRSISPLLDRPSNSQVIKTEVGGQFGSDNSPVKGIKQDPSLGNLLKKENSQGNLMKNLRDQVKLQKAESSANLNKQQENRIQSLIDSNAQQHQKKQDLISTLTKNETHEKTDIMPNSPISVQKMLLQNNNMFTDSSQKLVNNSSSLAFQFSQNSSCNELFNNTQGIKKSSSALLMNKIQPIEEVKQKQVKNEEEKKKRSISPFSNTNAIQVTNKSYYKNTVSQQNKINDKTNNKDSKDVRNRTRSPIQNAKKQDRSISNPRKKSLENNSNISKPKIVPTNSNNIAGQIQVIPKEQQNKEKNPETENIVQIIKKEVRCITPTKNVIKTPSKEKSLSKTPIKDQQINPKTPCQTKTPHNEENTENSFQPQISEQSKKIATVNRQKGVAIHERLYNEAKKELKKKEQWDLQLKKILNKNQNSTPNQKGKDSNQLAYFQLKSIHQNGKVPSKPKDYVIYQNNNSPFKPKEPEFIKKKREVSSERDENKKSTSQKYAKCNSQGLLFHGKDANKEGQNQQPDSKSINNQLNSKSDQTKSDIENKLIKSEEENIIYNDSTQNQIDHDSLIKQQQQLLSFYQNSSTQSKPSTNEKNIVNINLSQFCKTQEDQSNNMQSYDLKSEMVVKTMPDGLIFQKKSGQSERENLKVSPRYKTYDNQETDEESNNKQQNYYINSQNSSRRMSEQSQCQNRLETQLFQNQLKQLQLQEEMINQYKGQKEMQSIDNVYNSLQQNIMYDPLKSVNTNQSQVKKSDQNEEKVKKVLEYIFFALDSDSDGQISTDNIDLTKLNSSILILIQDVLIDVENLGGFVDFGCFSSLAKRRGIEQQLIEYVFNDNNNNSILPEQQNQQEQDDQLHSNYTSSYFTKPNNQKNQEYFNEYEKQAMEFFGKQKENNIRLSGALLTNESLTPELFFEKKQEYFDVKEYQNKLEELQKKSNQYDFKLENKEEHQQQLSSRYQNFMENEDKFQQSNASPAFGSDSIYRIKK